MMNKFPLVSVIMPAYNAEMFVEEAINSVLAQTLTDWELLVIDDCSTDGTARIVAEFAEKDSRIQLIRNESNMRVAKTRNKGLSLCKGQYVALLDSDDCYKPEMLQKMVDCAQRTNADIVYCSYELIDEQGMKVCNDFIVPEQTDFEKSLVRSVITCSSVLLTCEVAKSNSFPTSLYHEDIALWFQLLRDGAKACGVTEVLAAYRQRSGSKSANKFKSAIRRWNVYRKHLGLPAYKCLGYMIKYAYDGVIKYKKVAVSSRK